MKEYETYFMSEIEDNYNLVMKVMTDIETYIASSSAGSGSGDYRVHPALLPKFYNRKDLAVFQKAVKTMYRICTKVTRAYLKNPRVRDVFGFSPDLTELILTDPGYDNPIPIARFDIFYNEETRDYTFCEINTDGTSAMNENREMTNSLKYNLIYKNYSEFLEHRPIGFELFDTWVKTFLSICPKNKPSVGIVDFLDHSYLADLVEFEKHFKKAGLKCEVCEITKMRFDGKQLCSEKGTPIDAVYRRAVTKDVMHAAESVPDFLAAIRARAVTPIGAFRTQIVHTKAFFALLRHPVIQELLSDEENRYIEDHVPLTRFLGFENAEDIIPDKDNWIIKPVDGYGASNIHLGRKYSAPEWDAVVHELAASEERYVFQRFTKPYQTPNAAMKDGMVYADYYHNLTGLYVYGGRLAGIYSRICEDEIISGSYGGREIPTLIFDLDR